MTHTSIPHVKHTLENGLEVILHEDHACPVVSVYVYYHVGSSREEPGRSGFAHLFEHMLFQGSKNVEDNGHFRRVQGAGGTLNGTTNVDRTNYFETLPSNQLELALWLESDRMGLLLPAMTQAKLDNQRDVVSNERRQSYENRPYGLVHETLLRHLYPQGHPYHWPTIGSMEDIAAADLGAVTHFFRRWYGPNNASLVIAGDFDPTHAMALVEAYFGGLRRGPEVAVPNAEAANLGSEKRILIEDQIQIPQLTVVWPTVQAWHADEPALGLLMDVLSANKCSLLDAALELDEQLVTSITASHHAAERAGTLTLNLRPNPGVSLERLLERLDELLLKFVEHGVSAERIENLKARSKGALLRSMETVAQRAAWLGIDNCLGADPGRIAERFQGLDAVGLQEVLAVARRYVVGMPRVLISTVPKGQRELALPDSLFDGGESTRVPAAAHQELPELALREGGPDRSQAPEPAPRPSFQSPVIWHGKLANGLPIVGALADRIPISRLSVAFPAGRLRESSSSLGLSELTARLLNEGTQELTPTALVDTLDGLGANLSAGSGEDDIVLSLSVLDEHIERGMGLLQDLIASPRFAAADFERLQRQLLVDQRARLDQAGALASEGFRGLLFGSGPKGASSLGTPASIASLSAQDVRDFWRTHADPARARITYMGGLGRERVEQLLAPLGALEAAPPVCDPELSGDAGAVLDGRVHLIDKPGAKLSELRIGHRGVARSDPEWFPLFVMNYILGGSFTSRLNLNLREDKGYTYGIRSSFVAGSTQGSFVVSSAVDTRVTAAAVGEILGELRGLQGGLREDEVEFARSSLVQSLLRTFESPAALMSAAEAIGKYAWADDYPAERLAWLKGMQAAELSRLARAYVNPDRLCILVVGDRASVEPELIRAGLRVD